MAGDLGGFRSVLMASSNPPNEPQRVSTQGSTPAWTYHPDVMSIHQYSAGCCTGAQRVLYTVKTSRLVRARLLLMFDRRSNTVPEQHLMDSALCSVPQTSPNIEIRILRS